MDNKFLRMFRQLKRNESGVAMVELAVSLPFFLGLVVGGVETVRRLHLLKRGWRIFL